MNRIAFVLITLFVSGPAFAQTPPVGLTLDEAIARGFDNSHRLAEARARHRASMLCELGPPPAQGKRR